MSLKLLAKSALFLVAWVVLTLQVHMVLDGLVLGFDYPYIWHPGNAYLTTGLNPYSSDVAERIFYSLNHRPSSSTDELLYFMYPPYVLAFLFPIFFLPLDWAAAAWLVLNILSLISFVPLLFPQVPKWLGLSLILFYEAWFTCIIGNYALIIFVFLLFAFLMLLSPDEKSRKYDWLSGMLMAWTTVKPQMVVLLVGFLLLYTLKKKRVQFLYSFFTTLALLLTFSFIFIPTWLQQWLEAVRIYMEYSPSHQSVLVNYLSTIASPQIVMLINGVLMGLSLCGLFACLIAWYRSKFPTLLLIALCVFVQNLFGQSSMAPNRLVLILPIFLYVVAERNVIKAKVVWWSAIAVTNLFFILSIVKILPHAGDYYTIWVYAVFLIVLLTDPDHLKVASTASASVRPI